MIKLLLVEQHPIIREGFKRLLERDPVFSVVGEAESGRDGYLAYLRFKPDIVVMELALPDVDGLEIARKIFLEDRDAKILAFDNRDNEALIRRTQEMGFRGFLCKRTSAKTVLESLQAVADGGVCFDASVVARSHSLFGWGIDQLTPREFDVFRHLAAGLSVSEIAQLLDSCPKTVGVHQTRIMKKLAVSNSAQLAHLALSSGVIHLKPPAASREPIRERRNNGGAPDAAKITRNKAVNREFHSPRMS